MKLKSQAFSNGDLVTVWDSCRCREFSNHRHLSDGPMFHPHKAGLVITVTVNHPHTTYDYLVIYHHGMIGWFHEECLRLL